MIEMPISLEPFREYEAECELARDNVNYFTRIIDGYEKMEEDREDG